ncbi:hypothetical protein M0R45_031027 [Rubus argutus]|uniref:ABC transmembrane type-1 domain-containing protein n=1 Tax=Rubus argutus TaxID=59490 RepID=A0AAW1WF80_RUBAR
MGGGAERTMINNKATLMIVGSLCAIGNGLSQPLMTLVFGGLINTFGATDPDHIVPVVSKVSLKFLYLAIGTGLAAFLQVSCWMVTGERQLLEFEACT